MREGFEFGVVSCVTRATTMMVINGERKSDTEKGQRHEEEIIEIMTVMGNGCVVHEIVYCTPNCLDSRAIHVYVFRSEGFQSKLFFFL